jgi:hypothetical protein
MVLEVPIGIIYLRCIRQLNFVNLMQRMTDAKLLNDAQHWRRRAEQAWVLSEDAKDAEAVEILRGIARSYERLAERADKLNDQEKRV